jgi:hypothetical protein
MYALLFSTTSAKANKPAAYTDQEMVTKQSEKAIPEKQCNKAKCQGFRLKSV